MHLQPRFAMTRDEALDLVAIAEFGDLVSVGPQGIEATPLPLLYRPAHGKGLGSVITHLARANDHWRSADGADGLVIVRGADGYIRPQWYASKREHGRVVPTWDYLAVHVRGRLVVHEDPAWLESAVRDLTDRHESQHDSPWSIEDAPPPYIAGNLRAIVSAVLEGRQTVDGILADPRSFRRRWDVAAEALLSVGPFAWEAATRRDYDDSRTAPYSYETASNPASGWG